MATVLNRTTLELIESAHTPDYDPAEWIVDPDLSQVAGVPRRYWKIVGDAVVPMTAPEAAQVDADIADAGATVPCVTLVFSFAGSTRGSWLGYTGDRRFDDVPWFAHADMRLSVAGWSCATMRGEATVKVYANNTLVYTFVTSSRHYVTTKGVGMVEIPAGSTVRVRMDASRQSISDPIVWLVLRERTRTPAVLSA